jgi:hypothetical protein
MVRKDAINACVRSLALAFGFIANCAFPPLLAADTRPF